MQILFNIFTCTREHQKENENLKKLLGSKANIPFYKKNDKLQGREKTRGLGQKP